MDFYCCRAEAWIIIKRIQNADFFCILVNLINFSVVNVGTKHISVPVKNKTFQMHILSRSNLNIFYCGNGLDWVKRTILVSRKVM